MEALKGWLQSRTIVAAAIGLLITVADAFNIEAIAGLDAGPLTDHVYAVLQAVFYAIAIVGRVRATKVIATAPVVPKV